MVGVRVSNEEHEALSARADAAGVSLPRLLLEAALGPEGSTPPERRAWFAALLAARRQLAGAANNLNQLTRLGNIDKQGPAEVGEAAAAVERCANQLGEVLETFRR
jgi:hypothetical protein